MHRPLSAAIGICAHSEASHPRTVGECSVRRAVVDGRKDVYWPSALAGGAILFGPLRIARPVRSRQRAAPPLSYGPSRARPRTDGRTGIKRPTNPPTGTIICPGPTASAGERLSPPRLRGTKVCRYSWHSAGSIGGVAYSGVRRMNEVNARRPRLAPGWVTVFGRVYHLGM